MEADASKLANGAATACFGVFAIVVVAAWITVRLVVCQHVPHGGQDVVLQHDVRALATDSRSKTAVPGPEIRVLRTPRRESSQPKCRSEPSVARAGPA